MHAKISLACYFKSMLGNLQDYTIEDIKCKELLNYCTNIFILLILEHFFIFYQKNII